MKTWINGQFYEVNDDIAVIYNGEEIPIVGGTRDEWGIVIDSRLVLLHTFEVDGVLWYFSNDLQELEISQFVTDKLPETGISYTDIEWFKTLHDPDEDWVYHVYFKLKGAEKYRSGWQQAGSEAELTGMLQNPEYIGLEDNGEEWLCLCGNTSFDWGFYPCDAHGNDMEPLIGSGWNGLYLCGKCGRIIHRDNRKVVGRRLINEQ